MKKIILVLIFSLFLFGESYSAQFVPTNVDDLVGTTDDLTEGSTNKYLNGNAFSGGDVTGTYPTLSIGTDKVNDTHIDFGTGTNQVSQDDLVDGTTAKKFVKSEGTVLPATCTATTWYFDTDSNDCADTAGGAGTLCYCKTTNTWVKSTGSLANMLGGPVTGDVTVTGDVQAERLQGNDFTITKSADKNTQTLQCVISFTTDDACATNMNAWNYAFDPAGENFTAFITTNCLTGDTCTAGSLCTGSPTFLTPAQLVTLQAGGNEIGSHGKTHSTLDILSSAGITTELSDSLSYLTGLGLTVNNFAYPGGLHSLDARELVRQYYRSGRGISQYQLYGLFGTQYEYINSLIADTYDLRSLAIDNATVYDNQRKLIDDCVNATATNPSNNNDTKGRWLVFYMHDIANNSNRTAEDRCSYPSTAPDGNAADDVCMLQYLLDYAQEYQLQGLLKIATVNEALDIIGTSYESGGDARGVKVASTGEEIRGSLYLKPGGQVTDYDFSGTGTDQVLRIDTRGFTSTTPVTFHVEVTDTTTNPDQVGIDWNASCTSYTQLYKTKTACETAGYTWATSTIDISAAGMSSTAQTDAGYGVKIYFANANSGHVLGDIWTFTVYPSRDNLLNVQNGNNRDLIKVGVDGMVNYRLYDFTSSAVAGVGTAGGDKRVYATSDTQPYYYNVTLADDTDTVCDGGASADCINLPTPKTYGNFTIQNTATGDILNVSIANNGGVYEKTASSIITRTKTLTSAEVIALQGTGTNLTPLSGTNKAYEFLGGMIYHDNTGATWTGVGGDEDLQIQYSDTTPVSGSIETTGWLDQTTDVVKYIPSAVAVNTTIPTNSRLVIVNVGAGEIGAEGSSETNDTLTVQFSYIVRDFNLTNLIRADLSNATCTGICIYDGGSNARIINNSGSSTNITVTGWYDK